MKLYILSGASRGMGLAMARQLLAPDHLLLGLSRRQNAELQREADARGCRLLQWAMDLATRWHRPGPAGLAHPAGRRGHRASLPDQQRRRHHPARPVDGVSLGELSSALRVGLEATVLLSAAFLHATRGWAGTDRRVLNISSGLGRRAMAGSAPYCAAKAGMDNFSCAVALDEATRPDGARIVSLAPGIIDTDMQAQRAAATPPASPTSRASPPSRAKACLTVPRPLPPRFCATWRARTSAAPCWATCARLISTAAPPSAGLAHTRGQRPGASTSLRRST